MELLEYLEERKEELKKQINDISVNFCENYSLYSGEYLSDLISEHADSEVSIYYSDIFEFAKNNFEDVNDAIAEFGLAKDSEGNPDIIRTIQSGEYLANERALYDDIDNIKELLIVDYLIDNIDNLKFIAATTEEFDNIIGELVGEFDESERIDNVCDAVNDKFSIKESK